MTSDHHVQSYTCPPSTLPYFNPMNKVTVKNWGSTATSLKLGWVEAIAEVHPIVHLSLTRTASVKFTFIATLPECPDFFEIILERWMKRKKRWVLVHSSRTAEWASVTSFFWSVCLEATARHSTCRHHKVKECPRILQGWAKRLWGTILDYERTEEAKQMNVSRPHGGWKDNVKDLMKQKNKWSVLTIVYSINSGMGARGDLRVSH